jgi:ubiquinone/menaquinone biosynthesis C-methylase UbiE
VSPGQPPVAALFGSVAASYARHRPTYPRAFFEAFVQRLPARPVVWDCGCGSGQASLALAGFGVQVLATDASAEQLAAAPAHPLVHYTQAPAEASGLAENSVDGVLVAAAVHWFAGEAFDAELRRVCRPGAVMAWIGYLPLVLELAPLQQAVQRFYAYTLAPWWPPQRELVERSYAGLVFPGEEWPFPQGLEICRCWTLIELLGYLGSWSAVAAAQAAAADPLPAFGAELAELWPGGGSTPVGVRWPFMGRWGQVQARPR